MKGVKMINIHKLDNVEALIENPTQPQPVATPRPVEGARPGLLQRLRLLHRKKVWCWHVDYIECQKY